MNNERLSIERLPEMLGEDSKKFSDELALSMRNVMCGIAEELLEHLLKGIREARQRNESISPIQGVSTSVKKPKPASTHKKQSINPQGSIQGYLRHKGAAEYLGVSYRTVSDWMRRGVIPYHKLSHRVCLFRKERFGRCDRAFSDKCRGRRLQMSGNPKPLICPHD